VMMSISPKKLDLAAMDISENVTNFLICQQALKFDPAYDDIYPRIAMQSGSCRFWFVRDRKFSWASEIIEKRISEAFVSAGLEAKNFVSFIEWLPGGAFWGLLDEMDIYLDTPAFSGYTTAWQAIHRGLPIVTYEGRYMRQRLAAGLLRRVGVVETIASDIDEYVSRASFLAQMPLRRKELRALLMQNAHYADEDINVVRVFENTIFGNLQKKLIDSNK
ncbi:MAG: hypothetical protein HGA22_09685, partial [Clostridiales bacterium]|nr:hypothetical protein [Clostridiales bacterium]